MRRREARWPWPYRNTLGLAIAVFVASFGIGLTADLHDDRPTGYVKPMASCVTCHG